MEDVKMTILKMDNLTALELEKILSDKINSLRELEMEMEEMYRIGFHEGVDHLEMISDPLIDDIIEIENLLNHEK